MKTKKRKKFKKLISKKEALKLLNFEGGPSPDTKLTIVMSLLGYTPYDPEDDCGC